MPWKKSGPMEQRTEFAFRAMQTLNFRALCQQYGISTKTGYKWRERFWRQGLAGMEEESRRPKSHSKQLPEEEVCEIVRLKLAHMAWGRARSGSLIEEALESAVDLDVEGIPVRVFTAEYLAAVALQTSRAKDKARLLQFFETGALDRNKFETIVERHRLTEKWRQFQQQFLQ